MDKGVSGDVVPSASSNFMLDPESIPSSAWQEILKKLNRRSQSSSFVWDGEYNLTIERLRQLIEKLIQEFSNSVILSSTCAATVVLSNNERIDFSNWGEFDAGFDTSRPEKTRSVSFELVVDIAGRMDGVPERFLIQVSVQNNPAMFGIQIGPLGILPIDGFGMPPAPLVAKIDFNNFIMGKNLASTIENWEKSLEKSKRKSIKWLQKHSEKIAAGIQFSTTMAGIFFARVFWQDVSEIGHNIGQSILYSVAAIYVFYSLGRFVGRSVERNIDRQRADNNISLTEGDRLFRVEIEEKNKNHVLRATAFACLFIVEIVVSVYATRMFDFFGL